MQIPTSRMCSTLYSTYVLPNACLALCPTSPLLVMQLTLVPSVFGESFFDNGFLHDPVSVLHPFTIFKCFLYTLIIRVLSGVKFFFGGTYTSIYMYVCIYTHAWRVAGWRGASMMLCINDIKTTLMHAACISGFLSE